jgi:hypothetical protein
VYLARFGVAGVCAGAQGDLFFQGHPINDGLMFHGSIRLLDDCAERCLGEYRPGGRVEWDRE